MHAITPEHVAALYGFARAVLLAAQDGSLDSAAVRDVGVDYGLLVNMGLRGAEDDSDPYLYRLAPWLQAPH